jgi:hypothetical protein
MPPLPGSRPAATRRAFGCRSRCYISGAEKLRALVIEDFIRKGHSQVCKSVTPFAVWMAGSRLHVLALQGNRPV